MKTSDNAWQAVPLAGRPSLRNRNWGEPAGSQGESAPASLAN
jgi:hypothetical protein